MVAVAPTRSRPGVNESVKGSSAAASSARGRPGRTSLAAGGLPNRHLAAVFCAASKSGLMTLLDPERNMSEHQCTLPGAS